MAREAFAREFTVPASPQATWATMTDVDRLVGWISVLEEAVTIAPLDAYTAQLADRVGMFSLRADLAIKVLEQEEFRRIRATAEGEDRQIGSRIQVDLELDLQEQGEGTELRVSGAYEVTGRVATLGSSTIRRKADKILEEFFSNLSGALT